MKKIKLLSLISLVGILEGGTSAIFAAQTYSCPDIRNLKAVEVHKGCWRLQDQNGRKIYPKGTSTCEVGSPGDKIVHFAYAEPGDASSLICYYGGKDEGRNAFVIQSYRGSHLIQRIKSGECHFKVPAGSGYPLNIQCGGTGIAACTVICK